MHRDSSAFNSITDYFTILAEHVQAIIRACAPSIHALRVLRCHGLSDEALLTAYRAIVVAKLTYAPAVPGGASPPLTTAGA